MNDVEIFNDHFQNFKVYGIPKAQLLIADPPYNLGNNAYASNPMWYKDGDNKNGESELAGKEFFDTDTDFRPAEFMHFCSQMLRKEPKNGASDDDEETTNAETEANDKKASSTDKEKAPKSKGNAPCMVLFCAFEQLHYYIDLAARYGLKRYIPLVFRKNFSAQVLKANMKIVGNCEYGLVLYRDRLPKFNNDGRMIFNCFDWPRDNETPHIHPCLPAGEMVYVGGVWKKIEDVVIGERNDYGIVSSITTHEAERIIEISSNGRVVKATYNHPFLILRGTEIAWCEAALITDKDYILCEEKILKTLNAQKKDMCEYENQTSQQKCFISKSGKNDMGKFQMDTKSTTSTELKTTIALKISNLSVPLNTNGYTKVAELSTENGISRVLAADNSTPAQKNIGISIEEQSTEDYARNAISEKSEFIKEYALQKIESVSESRKPTRVYNLSIEGIPAFDTLIGLSHNTQKPVPLLERLIEIFTDKGDVVIDPCCGSGSTLLAASNCGRKAYGFEIKKEFYEAAKNKVLKAPSPKLF